MVKQNCSEMKTLGLRKKTDYSEKKIGDNYLYKLKIYEIDYRFSDEG